jgi:hypothetical protein
MDGTEELRDALSLVRVFARQLDDVERRLRCEIARRAGAERQRRLRARLAAGCKKGPARRRAA